MHHFVGLKHKMERQRSASSTKTASRAVYVAILDKVTLVAGIVGPFTVLPQVWQIFTTQSASGVSLISWALIFIVTLPWVFYGFAHRDRSIIASFILWEIVNALVVIGVLLYG
jgi:uncharacterized protein with PQ loop repeat